MLHHLFVSLDVCRGRVFVATLALPLCKPALSTPNPLGYKYFSKIPLTYCQSAIISYSAIARRSASVRVIIHHFACKKEKEF